MALPLDALFHRKLHAPVNFEERNSGGRWQTSPNKLGKVAKYFLTELEFWLSLLLADPQWLWVCTYPWSHAGWQNSLQSRCSTALRAISRPLPRYAPCYTTFIETLNRCSSHTRLSCSSRCLTTAATATSSQTSPPPVGPSDPKIGRIVDDISGLTLLQAADLVTLLKVCKSEMPYINALGLISVWKSRLNIQEIAVPTAAAPIAAAAPAEAEAEVVSVVGHMPSIRADWQYAHVGEAQRADNIQCHAWFFRRWRET